MLEQPSGWVLARRNDGGGRIEKKCPERHTWPQRCPPKGQISDSNSGHACGRGRSPHEFERAFLLDRRNLTVDALEENFGQPSGRAPPARSRKLALGIIPAV
jgi:hypothetical protein